MQTEHHSVIPGIQHLEILSLNKVVPDEGEIGSKAEQPLHGIADQRGRHIEARVPALWDIHDPLMLRSHGDQCVHLGTSVLTTLGHCPHKLPTCSSSFLQSGICRSGGNSRLCLHSRLVTQ